MNEVSLKVIWNSVYRKLCSELGNPVVDSWISPLFPDRIDGDTLYLVAPSMFFRDWVLNNYHQKIVDVCNKENSSIKRVNISVFHTLYT